MKLSKKNKLIEIWRAASGYQHFGEFFGVQGYACALGHLYMAHGLREEADSWSLKSGLIDKEYGLDMLIDIEDYPEFKDIFGEGGPVSLGNLIVGMNDSMTMTLNEIADWVDAHVIPEDLPAWVPTEWSDEHELV